MAVIKFEPNVPQTMAFTYSTGKESPSQQFTNSDGSPVVQWFRKTKAGDSVYLSGFVENELVAMNYRAGEPVTICKRVQGKTTHYEVSRPGESSERPLAGQPAPPAPRVAPPPARMGTPTTVMQNCLRTAVDLAIDALEYAKGKGHPIVLEFEPIQRIAVSLYIDNSKGAHIRQMHDLQQERAIPLGGQHAQNGSNAEFARAGMDYVDYNRGFAKAGTQTAAEAVARRKIAEFADGSPIPEEPAWANEDLSFLGGPAA
jgi:hypothetical protein